MPVDQALHHKEYQLHIQEKVFSEQIKILHHNLLASVPANLVCAFIIFIGLYKTHNEVITTWFAAILVVSILRMLTLYYYRYSPHNNRLHLGIFIAGLILSASLWGTVDSILMPTDPLEQTMIIVVIAGVTAGGIQTLNSNLAACFIYLSTIILPLCVWIFMQNDFSYTLLGITIIVYFIFMIIASRRNHKLLATSLYLQFENSALIEKLSASNTQLLHASKSLYEQSTHDPLTGLFNRRYLDETLSRELQRTVREKKPLCVAMLDLDFFKHFNDTHGHDAGDEILKFVAKLLQDTFRGSDINCRFGGEEFTVVLLNTDLSHAQLRLENFRKLVKNSKIYFQDRLLPGITVSVGLAEAPGQGITVQDIIHAADTALYTAKNTGRDRIECAEKILS